MQFNKLTSWMSETKSLEVQNKEILSWLNESGSITSRIKSFSDFKLKLLRDSPGEVDAAVDDLIISNYKENNIREVLLYSDEEPLIYAKSIIPLETIRLGLGVLGNLKENPLGDILFSNPEIKKEYMLFSKFELNKKIFYGRKGIYTVRGFPFSVCEIFLINDS
ncbi:MAG: chorismate--pyruvate lyase family protein [Gammaproteobacteria bacterium]|tara:strand:- start:334 stop:825 length:492 start_codon:yes stop_codon:yes gene_type:complete